MWLGVLPSPCVDQSKELEKSNMPKTSPNLPAAAFDAWARDDRAEGMENEHWPFVKQAFDLIQNDAGAYLEIGVGTGYAIRYMATHQFSQGRCLGLDVSGEMAELAGRRCHDLENVTIKHANFLTSHFSEFQEFSIIFSMEVFYYFTEIQKGIDRAYSSLKPGGQLLVLVDYYQENKIALDWPEKYQIPIRLWSMADYRNGFVKAGFADVEQRQFLDPRNESLNPLDFGTLCTFGGKPA